MPFGGLLTVGIAAGTKLIGGAIASKGAKKASQQQQASAARAQQFAKERYDEAANISAPYRNSGEGALYTLSNLLSQYRQPSMPPSAMPWQRNQPQAMTMQNMLPGGMGGGSMMGRASGGMVGPGQAAQKSGVLMESPDGEQRQVPAHMVQAYLQRGGRVVPMKQAQPMMSEVLMP